LIIPTFYLSKIFQTASRGGQPGVSRVVWAVWAGWPLAAEEVVMRRLPVGTDPPEEERKSLAGR